VPVADPIPHARAEESDGPGPDGGVEVVHGSAIFNLNEKHDVPVLFPPELNGNE